MIESKKSNFERTVLVGIINNLQNEEKLNEFLEELDFLSLTAGGKVVRKFKQKINTPNPKTFNLLQLVLSRNKLKIIIIFFIILLFEMRNL